MNIPPPSDVVTTDVSPWWNSNVLPLVDLNSNIAAFFFWWLVRDHGLSGLSNPRWSVHVSRVVATNCADVPVSSTMSR